VVAFFENNSGDPAADWLSRGLPEMLTTDLSRFGDLDVIATQRLYDLLALAGRENTRVLDRSTASELARWAGANIVVSGSVFKAGERYRIDAQAYDTASGTVTVAHKVEGDQLFRMVNELTAGLRRGLRVSAAEGEALQAVTTSSEEAFRLYSQGQEHYDGLMFAEAAQEFERAIQADPAFDLARLRLAVTRLAMGDLPAARADIERLSPNADRMPEADRLVALGLRAYLGEGSFDDGAAYFEQLLEKYPGDQEAFVLWARALSDLAGEPVEATRKLRRALEQDPGNLSAVACLAEQMVKLGEAAVARQMLEDVRLHDHRAAEALERLIGTVPSDGS
jgi:tetratricopeptide (TPR) repeat protein